MAHTIELSNKKIWQPTWQRGPGWARSWGQRSGPARPPPQVCWWRRRRSHIDAGQLNPRSPAGVSTLVSEGKAKMCGLEIRHTIYTKYTLIRKTTIRYFKGHDHCKNWEFPLTHAFWQIFNKWPFNNLSVTSKWHWGERDMGALLETQMVNSLVYDT